MVDQDGSWCIMKDHDGYWWIMTHHDASGRMIMMDRDVSWCTMTHWRISMHHDESWRIMMDHDGSWCVMMNHDPNMHKYSVIVLFKTQVQNTAHAAKMRHVSSKSRGPFFHGPEITKMHEHIRLGAPRAAPGHPWYAIQSKMPLPIHRRHPFRTQMCYPGHMVHPWK